MAKGTATCRCRKCGAEFTREKICRNRADANNWEAWAAQNYTLCGACWKAEQDAEIAKKDAEFTPITVGSERQIAWAVKIRLKAVEKTRDALAGDDDPKLEYCRPRLIEAITSHDDARWYIDHHDALEAGPIGCIYVPGGREFWTEIIEPISAEYEKANA